jgi:hypothetical protein
MKDKLGLEFVGDRTVPAETGSMQTWHVTLDSSMAGEKRSL